MGTKNDRGTCATAGWPGKASLRRRQLSNRGLTILESEPRGIYRNDVPEEGASAKALHRDMFVVFREWQGDKCSWKKARGMGEEAGEGRK